MDGFAEATAQVRAQVDSGFLPGAVLGIATRDGLVGIEHFGLADRRDPYPLFSITKVLTGLTAARLVESGDLTLDTPLAAAVPEFGRDRDDVVALRHLVSHTAGIPEPDLDSAAPLHGLLLAPGRDNEAGAVSRYSSIGFQGVAALIEYATQAPWEAALAQTLAPVGAHGISLDTDATSHRPVLQEDVQLDWHGFADQRHPGAGAVGAVADVLRVAESLLRDDGAIVSPETLAMIRTPLTAGVPSLEPYPPESGTLWGFAVNLRRTVPGSDSADGYGHSGWAGTEMWIHPEHDVAWVLLTNVGAAGARGWDLTALDNAIVARA